MARYRTFSCPDCDGTFRFFCHPSDEVPAFCPLCGNDMREPEPVFEPAAPMIRDANTVRAADDVYKAMEQAGENRMDMAAEMTPGASRSDFTALKTTDLPGQYAQRHTPSLAYMQQKQKYGIGSGFGGAAGIAGAGFAGQVGSGPYPYAGAQSASQFQRAFPAMNAAIRAAGKTQ